MNVQNNRRLVAIGIALLVGLGMGCGEEQQQVATELGAGANVATTQMDYRDLEDGPHADHRNLRSITIYDEEGAQRYFDERGVAQFEYPDPFLQVGMRLEAQSADEFEYRVRSDGEEWSSWESVLVYWSEGSMHNGHVVLDEPATAIEFRGLEGLYFAQIDFFEEVTARQELILPGDVALETVDEDRRSSSEVRTVQQAVAPSSMVISRHEWGAIDPDKICGSVVDPYRMTLHHTASPDSDGGDAAERMQGMQIYHMNTLGWCDIGYHFVVAQSGDIYQGRSRSNRPAAHVGGQNWGNVGVSMIGNYVSSHPPDVQIDGVVRIMTWAHETHGIPLNRDDVRGHREWPDQSTSCPGDVGLSYLDDILGRVADGGEVTPPGDYDVDVNVLVHGLDDFYTQGSSQSVPDAFANQSFTAEIRVTNHSSEPIRDVELAYDLDSVGLQATKYRIDTDHPQYDQSSWEVNDANDAPDNPEATQLGSSGVLTMYAFSPNETKRVFMELETLQYNIGIGEFGGIRGWIRTIDTVYEVQESFGQEPDTNFVGGLLQGDKRIDILSRDEWQFRAGRAEDLEGWTADGGYEEFKLNTGHDLLALKIQAEDAWIVSPTWTEIDAEKYDELVLRVRSHDGDHTKAFYWTRDGEEFSEQRAVRFQSPGDSEYYTLVVPVGDHPNWGGTVDQIGFRLLDEGVPGEEDSGWYDVDYIYFQNRDSGSTSSQSLGIADETAVAVSFEEVDHVSPTGPGRSTFDQSFPGVAPDSGGEIETKGGCSTAGSSDLPPLGWMLVALVFGAVALRRQTAA